MTSDPTEVRLMLGGVGLVFVACGLFVHSLRRDRPALYFALYALAAGLHWGGPIATSVPTLETGLFLFYLVASDLVGVAFLVQFALHFTSTWTSRSGRWRRLLYLPALLAGLLSLGLLVGSEGGPLYRALLSVLPVAFLSSTLLSVLFLAVLLHRAWRPAAGGPSRRRLILLSGSFVLASLPSLLGAVDIYNLSFLLEPLVLTYVLLRPDVPERSHGATPSPSEASHQLSS